MNGKEDYEVRARHGYWIVGKSLICPYCGSKEIPADDSYVAETGKNMIDSWHCTQCDKLFLFEGVFNHVEVQESNIFGAGRRLEVQDVPSDGGLPGPGPCAVRLLTFFYDAPRVRPEFFNFFFETTSKINPHLLRPFLGMETNVTRIPVKIVTLACAGIKGFEPIPL